MQQLLNLHLSFPAQKLKGEEGELAQSKGLHRLPIIMGNVRYDANKM